MIKCVIRQIKDKNHEWKVTQNTQNELHIYAELFSSSFIDVDVDVGWLLSFSRPTLTVPLLCPYCVPDLFLLFPDLLYCPPHPKSIKLTSNSHKIQFQPPRGQCIQLFPFFVISTIQICEVSRILNYI